MEGDVRDEAGRFTKGTAPGPGRPKGTLSIVSLIKQKLEEVPEGEKLTVAEMLVDEYINDIRGKGDGIGIRDLIDRIDGKAVQTEKIIMDDIPQLVVRPRDTTGNGAEHPATDGVRESSEIPGTGSGSEVRENVVVDSGTDAGGDQS